MRRVLYVLVLLVIFFAVYEYFLRPKPSPSLPKQQALKAGKHSVGFNASIDSMLNAYFKMKDDFVEADSLQAKEDCKKMIALTDSLKLSELQKDTTGIFAAANQEVSDIKSNAQSLLQDSDITTMRQDFRGVTENIYPLLKTIHYEGPTVYLQNCPMAFGEGKDANWISNTAEIINPYLGKKNPEYHATMVGCGITKDSILAQ